MLEYHIELITQTSQIEKQIENEIISLLKKQFGVDILLVKSNLRAGIQAIIRKYIELNSTFISALTGELLGELGLPMDRRMWMANGMIDIITQGVEINSSLGIGSKSIIIDMEIIWSNDKMQELISRGEASYISSSGKAGAGGGKAKYQIPWLEWLLEGGGQTLISNFHIEYGDFPGSRTHMAVMKEGGDWNMPQGSFTPQNNFITQSIDEAKPEIIKYILENLDK